MGMTISDFLTYARTISNFIGYIEVKDVCFNNRLIFYGDYLDLPDYLLMRKCSVICKRVLCTYGKIGFVFYI